MKAVITGAAGFIGANLCERLVKDGHEVIAVDDLSNGKLANLTSISDRIKFHRLDITEKLPDDLFKGADTVFHLACSKCTVCVDNPIRDLQVNALGALNVFIHAGTNGCKVVHASTGSVYGPAPYHSEETAFNPVSFYGVSKLAGERYLQAVHNYRKDFRFTALRLFHVYGPKQDTSQIGGVVAIFIDKILRGEPIQIFGDGEQVRSFTHVDDVVDCFVTAAGRPEMDGQYFNVASGVRITINELVDMVENLLGVKAKREYRDPKPGDVRDFNVYHSKISKFKSRWMGFYAGIEKTIEGYR